MNFDRIIFASGILAPWLALAFYAWRTFGNHEFGDTSYLGWFAFGAPLISFASMIRKFSLWKFFGFGAALIPIAVCVMLLFGMANLPYDGPLKVGSPMPDFQAFDVDGKPFGRAELNAGSATRTLVVVYRGAW